MSSIDDGIFSIDSKPYGMSYADWGENWIKWALSTPKNENAAYDETGKNCAARQSGPVWFLAGTFGTSVKRHCVVPFGKAIFFPVIEKECSFAEESEQLKTEEELIGRASFMMDIVTKMEVIVDGHSLPDLKNYRVRSRVFDLWFPEDNVYNVPSGFTRSVTEGYWVFLKPLKAGKHNLYFSAEAKIPQGPIADITRRYVKLDGTVFRIEVTYDLKVA